MGRARAEEGFSLIELLIAMVVLAVLAAIAIPGLLTAAERSRQRRTMGDLRTVAAAVEQYALDHDGYPSLALGSATRLAPLLEPTYISHLPPQDAWGRPFTFAAPFDDATAYAVVSFGRDGLVDEGGWRQGALKAPETDIALMDGAFTQWPDGTAP